jgi:hypothetical protein
MSDKKSTKRAFKPMPESSAYLLLISSNEIKRANGGPAEHPIALHTHQEKQVRVKAEIVV